MISLSSAQIKPLFFSQLIVLAPVFFVLPKWMPVFWGLCAYWRMRMFRKKLILPNQWLQLFVLLCATSALAFSFDHIFSVETFVGFFVLALSLKSTELLSQQDGLLVAMLNFIALGLSFLFYQNLYISLFAIFGLACILHAWVGVLRVSAHSHKLQFKYAVFMVIKTLPVMLVLFVTMPRLGQLWNMPSQNSVGSTGISDSLSPGEFNQLIRSNEVAFRAGFNDGNIPAPIDRYWRGLVFEKFDGARWSRSSLVGQSRNTSAPHPAWGKTSALSQSVDNYNYSILIEPHQKRWLFHLMQPNNASSSSLTLKFKDDATLYAVQKLSSRARYDVSSSRDYMYAPNISKRIHSINTKLPSTGNQRSLVWAKTLRDKHGKGNAADQKIIEEVLATFRASFVYTLSPPIMKNDFVDQFLFDAQRGFCEHFSSSFAFLMRAAGIPSRVVVGYQGGELSPLENYIVVRQRDAHAWTELWLEGQGWVRFDPTAVVAPSRIERGIEDALGQEERAIAGQGFSSIALLSWLQLRLDLINFNWHKWVLGYDSTVQDNFFVRLLGSADSWRKALFFAVGCGGAITLYFLISLLPRRKTFKYSLSQAYNDHLRKIERLGFEKQASESALAFARRVAEQRPELKDAIISIADCYHELCYTVASPNNVEQTKLKDFIALCRRCSPRAS